MFIISSTTFIIETIASNVVWLVLAEYLAFDSGVYAPYAFTLIYQRQGKMYAISLWMKIEYLCQVNWQNCVIWARTMYMEKNSAFGSMLSLLTSHPTSHTLSCTWSTETHSRSTSILCYIYTINGARCPKHNPLPMQNRDTSIGFGCHLVSRCVYFVSQQFCKIDVFNY